MQLYSGEKYTVMADEDGHLYLHRGSVTNGGLKMSRGYLDKIYLGGATIVPGTAKEEEELT